MWGSVRLQSRGLRENHVEKRSRKGAQAQRPEDHTGTVGRRSRRPAWPEGVSRRGREDVASTQEKGSLGGSWAEG